jgi:hypothetical protein
MYGMKSQKNSMSDIEKVENLLSLSVTEYQKKQEQIGMGLAMVVLSQRF